MLRYMLLGAAMSLSISGLAQESSSPSGLSLGQDSEGSGVTPESKSFNFSGATLEDFVDEFGKTFPEHQIVMDVDAAALPIQKFRLKNATDDETLRVLQSLMDGQIVIEYVGRTNTITRIQSNQGLPPFVDSVLQFRIVSIDFLLPNEQSKEQHAEALTSLQQSIDYAIQFGDPNPKEKLKILIHPDAKMLMLRGTEASVRIVEFMIEDWRNRYTKEATAKKDASTQKMEATIKDLRAQIEVLIHEIQGYKHRESLKQP